MEKHQNDDHPAIQHLIEWVNKTKDRGIRSANSGSGDGIEDCYYVSHTRFQEYYRQPQAVEKLLDALFGKHDPLLEALDAHSIRNKFHKIFTILIFIGRGRFISYFVARGIDDARLPLRSGQNNFPTATSDPGFWTKFDRDQWKFCVSKLDSTVGRTFDANEYILPIRRIRKLGEGGTATAYEIEVPGAYNQLNADSNDHTNNQQNSGPQSTGTYVLKSYHRTRDAEKHYNSEWRALKRLHRLGPCPQIIGFYGSFILDGTFNIVLEYANKGTLEDYLRSIPPPCTAKEIIDFWHSLLKVTIGFLRIHHMSEGTTEEPQIFQGWHQDIKPTNILIKTGDQSSKYEFECKVADLGLSHSKKSIPSRTETTDTDARGTSAYGALECHRVDSAIEKESLQVKQSVDVWSLGCVLSEAATWVAFNWNKVEEYRQRRSNEATKLRGLKVGDCFHNGKDGLLNTVQQNHADLVGSVRPCDFVTPSVLKIVTEDMLRTEYSHARRDLFYLHTQSTELIRKARERMDGRFQDSPFQAPVQPSEGTLRSSDGLLRPPEPPSFPRPLDFNPAPQSQYPGSQKQHLISLNGSSPTNDSVYPAISSSQQGFLPRIEEAHSETPAQNTVAASKVEEPVSATFQVPTQDSQDFEPPPTWPVRAAVQWRQAKKDRHSRHNVRMPPEGHLLASLKERDHVFVIDTAASMNEHWTDVRELLDLLGYIVKHYDDNGVDIYFTNSSSKHGSVKTTTELLRVFDLYAPYGVHDMSARLWSIVADYQEDLRKLHASRSRLSRLSLRRVRPLSLYVLTDAVWQPVCDVSPVITSLVGSLTDLNLHKKQVGIQFIRFGHSSVGIERLEVLDRLKQKGYVDMDIVDTEPADGNVWKMLFGPINDWFDGDSHTNDGSPEASKKRDSTPG